MGLGAAAAAAAAIAAACGVSIGGGHGLVAECRQDSYADGGGGEGGGGGVGRQDSRTFNREDSRTMNREDSRSAMWPNRDRPSEWVWVVGLFSRSGGVVWLCGEGVVE